MTDRYAEEVAKKDRFSLRVSDATAKAVEGPKPPAKLCPFVGVAVPNMDRKTAQQFPIVMETRECNASCALFDEPTGRTCLDRVLDRIGGKA